MKELLEECRGLSDEELERGLRFLRDREKRDLVRLLAHLAEYDRRRLPQKAGHDSTFIFCVRSLRYDEADAYRRVHAARAARRYPGILSSIADGSLTLTSILLLMPILNDDNQGALLREASGKSKREVEFLVASYSPKPSHPDSLRRLPEPAPQWIVTSTPAPIAGASNPVSPPNPAIASTPSALGASGQVAPAAISSPPEWQAVVPLSLERVRIGFDAAVVVMRLIDRARQVLRHKYPEGRLEDVLREALEILLDRKDPQRRLELKSASMVREREPSEGRNEPRFLRRMKSGRYIPARVKHLVWQRDEGRCVWRFDDGLMCGSRDGLEYDHVRPFARGGRSDDPRNVRLLCRLHNREAAEAAGLISPPEALSAGPSSSGTSAAAILPSGAGRPA